MRELVLSHSRGARCLGTWRYWAAGLVLLAGTQPVFAQALCANPSDAVATAVAIRRAASVNSNQLGRLPADATATVIGEVPHWYRIATPVDGFVSKAWVDLVPCEANGGAPSFTVHTIDVGTGLAVFVQGDDFSLLYDAGSKDDTTTGQGNRVLAYLAKIAPDLRVIDHLVISHAHDDHMALLPDIFDQFEVRNVWHSGATSSTCIYREVIERISAEPGVRLHTGTQNYGRGRNDFGARCGQPSEQVLLEQGGRITSDPVALGAGAWMQFLYIDGKARADANDNSLVLRMDLGSKRFLFTGDAGGGDRAAPSKLPAVRSVEGILTACCARELKSDVLIAGHHGSKTSSRRAFLDAVAAKHYIVSSGPYSYHGVVLPDAEVIEEFARRGQVWRTDNDDAQRQESEEKIGEIQDGDPGGCNSVVASVSSQLRIRYAPVP